MDELSDNEFDLLDELYFVQHFTVIKESLGWADELIMNTLMSLRSKGFIKLLVDHDTEYSDSSQLSVKETPWDKLYFLATKEGLLSHNGF